MVIGQLLAQQENAATEPDMDRGGGQTPEEEEKQIEEHVNSHQCMLYIMKKLPLCPRQGGVRITNKCTTKKNFRNGTTLGFPRKEPPALALPHNLTFSDSTAQPVDGKFTPKIYCLPLESFA